MRSLALAFALVLAGGAARAGDVPVQYLVDAKALKGAIAGTQLTLSLFSDAACATQVASSGLAVETLTIEEVKLVRPKGAPKPPKAARIVTTLAGVTPTDSLFLSVSGTGVVPIGSACQAQRAVPPLTGASIEDGSLRLGDLGGDLGPSEWVVATAITLDAGQCKSQRLGVFDESIIGHLVIGTLADANGDPVLPNAAAVVPSVVIGTTQGGAIPHLVVCNTGNSGTQTIPVGAVITWRAIAP